MIEEMLLTLSNGMCLYAPKGVFDVSCKYNKYIRIEKDNSKECKKLTLTMLLTSSQPSSVT